MAIRTAMIGSRGGGTSSGAGGNAVQVTDILVTNNINISLQPPLPSAAKLLELILEFDPNGPWVVTFDNTKFNIHGWFIDNTPNTTCYMSFVSRHGKWELKNILQGQT